MKDLHNQYQPSFDTWARLFFLAEFYRYDELLDRAEDWMECRACLIRHELTDESTSLDRIRILVNELQAGVRELWKDTWDPLFPGQNPVFHDPVFQEIRDKLVRHIAGLCDVLIQHDFTVAVADVPGFLEDLHRGIVKYIRDQSYEVFPHEELLPGEMYPGESLIRRPL